jgi:ABC-2 type transport system ATP-binding protein
MSPKVTVQNLKKRYGSVEAARGVSFEIRDGEIFGLIGPNGAGKTTTVECVIGLREPDEGAIDVCGIDARRRPREMKEKIGAALQTTALQDKITPREALALFGAFYRQKAEPAALLERFALLEKADAPFETLSGGQRQRLALALAFVNNPELVFLDEPTAGLDPQSRRELHGEIVKMKHEGHTVLLTTHYLNEAEALCDRIAIIDRGRIVATGTPRELVARSTASPSVYLATVQRLERAWLERIPGVEGLSCEDTSARFRSPSVRTTVAAVMNQLEVRGIEIAELHVSKATLEDVFLELTGRDEAGSRGSTGSEVQGFAT